MSTLEILITLLVAAILCLLLVFIVLHIVKKNQAERPVNRKWTDPKFHD